MENVSQSETLQHSKKLSQQERADLENKLVALKARLEECKVLDAGGKIQINGTFGKLGSCFSKIYSPDLMLGITLSGQFYLLTLIEHLYEIGVKVLSANTDGVTYGGTPEKMAEARKFIEVYGWASNFEFEFVSYASISFKDVNNYVAVKTNGDTKTKGLYAESGLMKNPTNEICSMAAANYMSKGTSVSEFIHKHLTLEFLPDFLQSRTVNGGAVYYTDFVERDDWVEISEGVWRKASDDKNAMSDTDWWMGAVTSKKRPAPYRVGNEAVKLGRVARWYYSTDPACNNGLRYATNGNLVPKSTGGKALLKLPDAVPADLDVQRYIDEAIDNLANMGVTYKEF